MQQIWRLLAIYFVLCRHPILPSEGKGHAFESRRVRQYINGLSGVCLGTKNKTHQILTKSRKALSCNFVIGGRIRDLGFSGRGQSYEPEGRCFALGARCLPAVDWIFWFGFFRFPLPGLGAEGGGSDAKCRFA